MVTKRAYSKRIALFLTVITVLSALPVTAMASDIPSTMPDREYLNDPLAPNSMDTTAPADTDDEDPSVTATQPTRDTGHTGFWIGLAGSALGGVIALVVIRRKSRRDDGDE